VNEVKEICAAVLDAPAPPMRGVDQVLAAARRSARRRSWAAGTGTGVAVAAATAAVLVVPTMAGTGPAGTGPVALGPAATVAAGTPSAPSPPSLPSAPGWPALRAHGRQIAAVLSAALPPGYTLTTWPGRGAMTDVYAWLVVSPADGRPTGHYVAIAPMQVGKDGRQGELSVLVSEDGVPAPTADLCSAPVSGRVGRMVDDPAATGARCQVLTIAGTLVRVVTEHDAQRGEVVTATRFLRDGLVVVSSAQGVRNPGQDEDVPPDAVRGGRVNGWRPPLARPVFTAAQVAAIAANPDLLP
jgi:hypothetical protein